MSTTVTVPMTAPIRRWRRVAVAADEVRRGEHDLPARRVLRGRRVLERLAEALAVGEVLGDLVEDHRVALHEVVARAERGRDADAERARGDEREPPAEAPASADIGPA